MFLGLFATSPNTALPPALAQHRLQLPAVFPTADGDGTYTAHGLKLYDHRRFDTWRDQDAEVPLVCPHTGAVLAFWGRLDNRDDLIAALNTSQATTSSATDATLVLAAWHQWGEMLPEHLIGDFALALFDPAQQGLLLVRDPLGVKPLYVSEQDGVLALANSVSALRTLPGWHLTPDTDWMARYMIGQSKSDTATGYREIHKVPPGQAEWWQRGQAPRQWTYHQWRDDAPWADRRDPVWVERYRSVLEESIRCRMHSDHPLGTENSGGIDSATITAYLAHFLGTPGDRLHSFGFALCEQEPAYILETSQACQITHNYLITAHGAFDDTELRINQALAVLGYPEEHGNGSGHIPFYRECQQRGIRTLFSGFGGDEVVTNPGHLLRYELLDRHAYANLWNILPGDPLRRSLRLGKALTLGRRSPKYRPTFLAAWRERWPHHLLRHEIVDRLDLHQEYMETARYDAPYRRINSFILDGLMPMPYIAARLDNCTLMGASYGIDYRWPLWDVRLVQQYLSTPSIEKVGPRGMGRYLHRRAIDAVVPKRVAWKPSKDMGYGQLHKAQNQRLQILATDTEHWLADLAPALVDLIDQNKLQRQLQQLKQGAGERDQALGFVFTQQIARLHQLHRWLVT